VSAEADELYSLLIPLGEDRLIVPRTCVVEVVRFSNPDHEAGAHSWMLGTVNWNGRQLPVVSFEGALGKEVPAQTGRSRIVVFYATTGQLKTEYFGILTQGFPQLVRVNKDVLKLDTTEGWPEDAPVFCRVKMINEFPLIPDLDRLEAMLARESIQA
jgi:chemosensory pili system protein ChpC